MQWSTADRKEPDAAQPPGPELHAARLRQHAGTAPFEFEGNPTNESPSAPSRLHQLAEPATSQESVFRNRNPSSDRSARSCRRRTCRYARRRHGQSRSRRRKPSRWTRHERRRHNGRRASTSRSSRSRTRRRRRDRRRTRRISKRRRHGRGRRRSRRRSSSWRPRFSSVSPSPVQLPCGLTSVEVFDLLSREITPDDYELLLRLDRAVAPPVASSDRIEALPNLLPADFSGGVCSICLMPFQEDSNVTAMSCKHQFHRGCISKWLAECRKTCPLCGKDA
ncbi:PJA1 [Symbiodinium sp. CCMP2592]|nr:PJA1 [Symbiodinium sp. CCMP2592]